MRVYLKRAIILQFLLWGFFGLNAQHYSSRMDSIHQLVQNYPQNSKKKIPQLLILLKYQYLVGSQTKMFYSLDQIECIGIEESDENYSEYLYWKANAYYLDKNYQIAKDIFKQLLHSENSEYHLKSLLGIAWSFKINTNTNDSNFYYFSQARKYAEKQRDKYLIAYYNLSHGKFLKHKRKPLQAKKYNNNASEFFENNDYPLKTGQVYANIAHCYYLETKYDSALLFGIKAIPYLKSSNSYRTLCSNYNVLGTVLQNMGRLNKSIEYYYQGFKIAETFEIDIMTAAFLYNLGNCHLLLKSYDKSWTYFKKCYDFALLKNDTVSHLYASIAMGEVAFLQGKNDIAESYYKQAQQLAQILKLKYIYSYFYSGLAGLAIEKHDYSLAQQYVDSAYFWAKPQNSLEVIVPINIQQSNIYELSGRPNKSISLLKKSLDLIRSADYLEIETKLLTELSTVYKSKKDYKKSLHYLELVQRKTDSLNVSSIMENIVNHELEYEYKKAEKINQLVREKAEIKSQIQIKTSRLVSYILAIGLLSVLIILVFLIFNIQIRKRRNKILREKNRQIVNQKDELSNMVTKLSKLTDELEDSNATKDKLFSIIGHDLRSPFNTICGFSEILLLKEPEKEKRHIFYEKINYASHQLVNLVDSLLIWSRSQMGKISFHQSNFNIKEILLESLEMNKMMAEKKSISLSADITENNNLQVNADKDMIKIILQNLIGNAIKYTLENGKISMGYRKDKSKIKIFVKDNGVGMSEEDLLHLKNSLIITSKSGTKGEKGTGLGLNICKDFIAQHGGELTIKSELDKGSEFSFEIKTD